MECMMNSMASPLQEAARHRSGRNKPSAEPVTCPLSRVQPGTAVRIKALSAPPEMNRRLREIGFGEDQVVRLLLRRSNVICLVCNARMALSWQLAQMILVEPLYPPR
jgi:Fe2+ transport system protein FeoA